ncbi:AmpG family muropeptide MFS transporter [Duganella violaceipulchra]|uniref:AmpG family muropeptide MFS transporter n=1 Tax=Duganella violaceipulchra TaxID=2849652 RepID=A0AA41HBB2_9BURK|nr:AmpG family muropeptide MFS transporter [Duganella violaceicalia]MBV6324225.1 AmpG family muropeptide MFS transporter [Duganella violaceicalia]MCP2011842.1 PAT family beta-lactamase induction signal transducer AmpG [Duganella violaceicalia]
MTIQEQPSSAPGWRTYLNGRTVSILFLGFSSGLPLYTLIYLMQAWLAKSGLDVKALGLFALVTFPYTFKFLWAPLMDRYAIGSLGRRRGWMAATQLSLFLVIGGLGMLDPKLELTMIAGCVFLIAFLSASQDVVIDAYRREILAENEQGLGAAIIVNAYKAASLIPSALGLVLADSMSWQAVFWIVAAFMLPGFVCTLLAKEPAVYGAPPKNLQEAVVLPFREFVQRDGWNQALLIIGFVLLYKIGDSMATALSTKFFLDIGFTTKQIGLAANATGWWAALAGGAVGGIWMIKLGINRALWVFGVLQAIAILGFAWLARTGPDSLLLSAVFGFEAFASLGLGAAALVAFMSRATDPRYTATQYALFSSLAAVPRTFINSSVGYIVAETGWFWFFIVCFILAFPAMMMLPKIAPWNTRNEQA